MGLIRLLFQNPGALILLIIPPLYSIIIPGGLNADSLYEDRIIFGEN